MDVLLGYGDMEKGSGEVRLAAIFFTRTGRERNAVGNGTEEL